MSGIDERHFLRHAVATLTYRAAKVLRTAPSDFGAVQLCGTSRNAPQILAHISDLLAWALWLSGGGPEARDSPPLPWAEEVDRFFEAVARLDAHLALAERLGAPADRLFQGPIADALTHVGQLAMLSRLAGRSSAGGELLRSRNHRGSRRQGSV